MTCTHILLSTLFATAAPAVRDTLAPPSATWIATAQFGVGRLGEDGAALLKPRLTYLGDNSELTLGVPLWLEIADLPPRQTDTSARQPRWLSHWDNPETYAAWLERLAWSSPRGAVSFVAGSLNQETLGHGTLVDHYVATWDPLKPRTGGRLDVNVGALRVSLLSDSFIEPQMMGGSVTLAPLALAGLDPSRRFSVTLDGAVDPGAPGFAGRSPVGGASLSADATVWQGSGFAFSAWAGATGMSTVTAGGHGGLNLSWNEAGGNGALALRLELNGGGRGYLPAYFDAAYSVERHANPTASRLAKAEQRPASRLGMRGSLDGRLGPVRFGLSAEQQGSRNPARGSLFVRLLQPRWSLAASLMQRRISEASDLWALGASTYAVLEASVAARYGLFTFAQVRHAPRREAGGLPRPVSDWLVGVGYGARDGD